jgi:hypothetical protein
MSHARRDISYEANGKHVTRIRFERRKPEGDKATVPDTLSRVDCVPAFDGQVSPYPRLYL